MNNSLDNIQSIILSNRNKNYVVEQITLDYFDYLYNDPSATDYWKQHIKQVKQLYEQFYFNDMNAVNRVLNYIENGLWNPEFALFLINS